MVLDDVLAGQARAAADQIDTRMQQLDEARAAFQRSVRALYLGGGSLREIAELLGLSHQRVHQLLDLPTRPPGRRRERARLECTFCGREQAQVRKLIAGPNRIGICDACVGLAHRTVARGEPQTDIRTSIRPLDDGKCSFCGKRPGDGPAPVSLATAADAVVCTECLALCDEILAADAAGSEPAES